MPRTRREILETAAAGGITLTALGGVGISAASSGPCHKDFACEDGTYVKYELVELDDGTCEFQEETDTGIYSDSLRITDTKDGNSCEPLVVSWDDTEYNATQVTAFGGDDCDTVEDPDGMYDAEEGLINDGGNTAATSNLQFCVEMAETLECPDGTRSLARYDVSGDELEFDGGEDVVTFSNKETDSDGNLTGFDFASTDGSDDNDEPETLTTVTVAYGDSVETFEVDPDFENDKQSGSVSVDGPISRVLFCQAVYAQADFVRGDVIEDICENGYGSDKISSITWSSYTGQLDGTQGQFDGNWDIGTNEVTVDYNSDNYDQKVSLSVYEVDDPVFQENNNISFEATSCRQTLVDSDTEETGNQDGKLTADFPSL